MEEPEKEVIEVPVAQPVKNKKTSIFEPQPDTIFSNKSVSIKLYKLNLYRPNGNLRAEISKAVYTELARQYGDVTRSIPSNRWSTMDEICDYVWAYENKSYLKAFSRTRKQIEEGVSFGVEVGAIITK